MNLEPVKWVKSEVSQKNRNKYPMLTQTWNLENGTGELIRRADTERTCGGQRVGKRWGRNRDSKPGIYTLHEQNRQLVGSCCVTQGLHLRPMTTQRSGDGEGGRLKRERIHIYTYGQFTLYDRDQYNISFKQLSSNF